MGKIKTRPKGIRRRLEGMPLRRALVVLMLMFISAGVLCLLAVYGLISKGLNGLNFQVYQRLEESGASFQIMYEDPYAVYNDQELLLQGVYQWAILLSPFVLSFLAAFGTATVFYRVKLKKSLMTLQKGAEKIAHNDLDFTIGPQNPDELGALCTSFETMRKALEENNRKMWRMMEERKRLNAAFAHDLRTPLTVLRGYSDFLTAYVPLGKVSEEKLLATVSTMGQHVERLEHYVADMNRIQSLEEWNAQPEPMDILPFAQKLFEGLALLIQKKGLTAELHCEAEGILPLDGRMAAEVAENLVANALRYAHSRIILRMYLQGMMLRLIIEDDGRGFSEQALQEGAKAFYKDAQSKKEGHFGLGLNICSLLCEKHGGGLALENRVGGGARVTASFWLGKK